MCFEFFKYINRKIKVVVISIFICYIYGIDLCIIFNCFFDVYIIFLIFVFCVIMMYMCIGIIKKMISKLIDVFFFFKNFVKINEEYIV